MQLTWKSFVAAMGAAVLLLALLGTFNYASAQDTTTDTASSNGLFDALEDDEGLFETTSSLDADAEASATLSSASSVMSAGSVTSVGGGGSSMGVSSNGNVVPTELPETGGGFRDCL